MVGDKQQGGEEEGLGEGMGGLGSGRCGLCWDRSRGFRFRRFGFDVWRVRSVAGAAEQQHLVAIRGVRRESLGTLAFQVPGEGDDLGDGAIQRFRNGVAEFQAGEQADQLGVLVDRYLVVAGDGQDRLGQFGVALGGKVGAAWPS